MVRKLYKNYFYTPLDESFRLMYHLAYSWPFWKNYFFGRKFRPGKSPKFSKNHNFPKVDLFEKF